MSLPRPEAGLVIRYSYLWLSEFQAGREEGVKDRPCAIVLTVLGEADNPRVIVVPVTHTVPSDPISAVELPPAVKTHLGLDTSRSWAILSECNDFVWPGPDLRRVAERGNDTVAYGFLPPRFFDQLRQRFVALAREGRNRRIIRTE